MQRSLFLLILMGQSFLFTCQLYQYHFIEMEKSWQDAQSHCRRTYTDLVTVYDQTDIRRLLESAKGRDRDAWTGLHHKPERRWRWSLPGVEYKENEAKWLFGQPDNRDGGQYCVGMQGGSKKWFDGRCTWHHKSICFSGTSSSHKFVVNEEVMTWLEALKYCRKHHTDLVSGVDQLEDAKQTIVLRRGEDYWIGLFRDPWRWSDGSSSIFRPWNQGPPDHQPRNQRCAALDKDSRWKPDNCNSTKPFFCYRDNMILIKEDKTWEEAIDHCRENYKDLVSITDPGQQRWVQERAKTASSSHVWLGLHYTCVLDVWFWVTNERLIYQNWASDVETDDCDMSGALETRGEHKWSKEKDVRKFNFFCSKP